MDSKLRNVLSGSESSERLGVFTSTAVRGREVRIIPVHVAIMSSKNKVVDR